MGESTVVTEVDGSPAAGPAALPAASATADPGAALAAAEERLHRLRASRDAWRIGCELALGERNEARRLARTVSVSRSYRLGRVIVSLVKNPARTARRLTRRLVTRSRRYARHRLLRRAAEPSAKAARRSPVRLYLALGQDPPALRSFVRAVAGYAVVTGAQPPVVVTDNPTFSLLRNLGVILEYLPDRRTWGRHRDEADWDRFLARRLARLQRDYGVDRAIVVDPLQPPDVAALIADGE
jgi:hypothetical protein